MKSLLKKNQACEVFIELHFLCNIRNVTYVTPFTVLHRDWLVVGDLDTKMLILTLQTCFYTQNTQFPIFFQLLWWAACQEYWVRPPSAAHRARAEP